jgi:hypothetical protein
MEIDWRFAAPEYISRAAYSLRKAQKKSLASLLIVSMLLAARLVSCKADARFLTNRRAIQSPSQLGSADDAGSFCFQWCVERHRPGDGAGARPGAARRA